MASKRRFDDSDESSNEDSSNDDGRAGSGDTDGEESELPESIENESENESEDGSDERLEDSNNVSSDEDDWQPESDVSSVESESGDDDDDDDDQEHALQRSTSGERSVSNTFVSKTGRVWITSPPVQGKIPQANILRQRTGLGRSATGIQTIQDAFQLLFTEEIISIIVKETNKRAEMVISNWNKANPGKKFTWKDTCSDEVWAFVGLLLLGGVQRSKNEHVDELWSNDHGRPIFRATMSKNRMRSLLRFCRFDDADTRDTRLQVNKMAPINEIWNLFLARLQTCFIPGDALTVDEQLMPTRARCKFRQYMPNKPGKYGIKIFWCCDSKTAYPLKGEVYVGRQPGSASVTPKNATKELVKRLVSPWINSGRSVTTDNYFTDVELAEDLLGLRTTLVGTIRKNKRDIPQELQPCRLRTENSSIFAFDRQLTLVSYVPRKGKAVILLSSLHHDMRVSEEVHKKPEIIMYYNETKGGVDRMDQMVQTYSCKRKINRWPMAVFFNIIDVAGIAAFIIWTTKNPQWNDNKRCRRRIFLQQLGRSLVDAHLNQRRQNPYAFQRGVRLAMSILDTTIASPVKTKSADGKRRRCHLCPRQRDRKVATTCSTCHFSCCPDHHEIICSSCLESTHDKKKKSKK